MTLRNTFASLGTAAVLATGAATTALAQGLPDLVPPPRTFANSTEHYQFLLDMYDGGTEHTYETVPTWEGLWEAGPNNVALRGPNSVFFEEGTQPRGLAAGGTIREGVLSEEYHAAFVQRREAMEEFNEQPYDRLTTCEPAGMPRWLLEPYVREWVNTPDQAWWMNDLANDTRRIYIGADAEHVNIEGTHFPNGDSIGFWAGEHLVVHTVDVWPMDYFRGYPPTSNQFEAVEVYHMETLPNGTQRIVMQGTFYDELGLAEPIDVVYTWRRAMQLESVDYRIRHWECESNSQTRLAADGRTTAFAVPGEAEYNDIRGADIRLRAPDLPADLSGQTRDPDAADFSNMSLDAALGGGN
ncbi:hypothetical protein HKCCE2091_02975 [Rhodobacterales bacterium HKCCE2091]|nr:hypothetical protein [Rhodobacterales bacterium HKCCE2091]